MTDALRLALQIAEALTATRRKGIVHRVLKPANVLVHESGAKLLDFALAQPGTPRQSARIRLVASRLVRARGSLTCRRWSVHKTFTVQPRQ